MDNIIDKKVQRAYNNVLISIYKEVNSKDYIKPVIINKFGISGTYYNVFDYFFSTFTISCFAKEENAIVLSFYDNDHILIFDKKENRNVMNPIICQLFDKYIKEHFKKIAINVDTIAIKYQKITEEYPDQKRLQREQVVKKNKKLISSVRKELEKSNDLLLFEDNLPKKSIAVQKDEYIVQSNNYTLAYSTLSKVQLKCMYAIIYKYQKDDYSYRGHQFEFEFSKKELNLQHSKESYVYQVMQDLTKKTFEILKKDGGWTIFTYLTSVDYDKEENSFKIKANPDFIKHIHYLSAFQNYSLLNINAVFSFESKFTQKMYELCCKNRNAANSTFIIDDIFLKKLILGQTTMRTNNFRSKVLDKARKELEESFEKGVSDIKFRYNVNEVEGTGDKVKSWMFFVVERDLYKNVLLSLPSKQSKLSALIDYICKYCDIQFKDCKDKKDIVEDYENLLNEFREHCLFQYFDDILTLANHITFKRTENKEIAETLVNYIKSHSKIALLK